MKKHIIAIFLIFVFAFAPRSAFAEENLSQRLSGYILLQTQSHGEAWYVYPNDRKKYFLGRPSDAFSIMRGLSLGATHEFIAGRAIYPDHVSGRILLDVEQNGEAYYIYPKDKKAYYLGKPRDAFNVMRNLGLGITNADLDKINTGYFFINSDVKTNKAEEYSETDAIFAYASNAVRNGNTEEVLSYFTDDMRKIIEYTMNFLDNKEKLTLGNIISGSKLSDTAENKKTYSSEVYFSGYKIKVNFYIEKQENGKWLITNL